MIDDMMTKVSARDIYGHSGQSCMRRGGGHRSDAATYLMGEVVAGDVELCDGGILLHALTDLLHPIIIKAGVADIHILNALIGGKDLVQDASITIAIASRVSHIDHPSAR